MAAAQNALITWRTQPNEVRYYRFDWDKELAPLNEMRAARAFELPFMFGKFGVPVLGDPNAPETLGVTWPIWAFEADLRRDAGGEGDLDGVGRNRPGGSPHPTG